jgi:hypothetical protein
MKSPIYQLTFMMYIWLSLQTGRAGHTNLTSNSVKSIWDLTEFGQVSSPSYAPLSNSGVPLVLATSPLPPLRFGAHPLSSLMFCPGDPHHLTGAESGPGPLTAKLYLCLSFIDCGKCDDSAFGVENRLYPRADSTIPKSELVVFGFYKRVNPLANISAWVRFSS